MWWDIIKGPNNHLQVIKDLFINNPNKAIGYIPIDWDKGQDTKIQQVASSLGLKYKKFPKQFEMQNPHPVYHSYSNGGHFMWDESKIEPYLKKLPFNSVDNFINHIAVNSYVGEPYRRIVDMLFGTPKMKLRDE